MVSLQWFTVTGTVERVRGGGTGTMERDRIPGNWKMLTESLKRALKLLITEAELSELMCSLIWCKAVKDLEDFADSLWWVNPSSCLSLKHISRENIAFPLPDQMFFGFFGVADGHRREDGALERSGVQRRWWVFFAWFRRQRGSSIEDVIQQRRIPTLLVGFGSVFFLLCRVTGNKESFRALSNSIRKFQPDIVFLSETKQKMRYLEKIKMKMKLEHSFYVEPTGLAGGLSLCWSKDIKINFLGSRRGSSGVHEKSEKGPWRQMGLIDMPILGGAFTWSNQRSDDEAILEKLDRVLCSLEWNILFPKVVAMLDIAIASDYAMVIIQLQGLKNNYKKEFKFESKWLLEEDCTSTVQGSWEPISQPRNSHRFGSKLRRTKHTLIRWSKLKDRVKNQRKIELQRRI
ncbi:hypothetical protein V6N12_002358 [Hibiscus sabdariffa]|uniref:Uncharacterized protein n=1 Tax=Hibiscus sabdariffa TaxID=183260 RepID=A0ABR2AMC1_9ROSI